MIPEKASPFTLTAIAVLLGLAVPSRNAAGAAAEAGEADVLGDVTILPAFNVSGERLEDFGFRVSAAFDVNRSAGFRRVYTPVVDVVLPNTAASRAGLRPGDRILKSDGQPTASRTFSIRKWRRIQETKWAAVAAGQKDVTWTLEVEPVGTGQPRMLQLKVPTPAPHWGAEVWVAPDDRRPAVVAESGPLADRARLVLDHGIWMVLRASYVRGLDLTVDPADPFFRCYQWTLWSGAEGHRIYVSQQRGRTDVILEALGDEGRARLSSTAPTAAPVRTLASPTTVFAWDSRAYLTSPSGALEKAWALRRGGPQHEIPLEEARAEFQREMDFWLNRVGPVSPRWPLVVIAGKESVADGAAPTPAVATAGERAAAFLTLPRADAGQRALFNEAFEKIGAEEDRWAYTETSRTIDDKRVTIVRVDPSRPESERCTLLAIDGRTPTAEQVQSWREEGHDSIEPLGELEKIREMVDRADPRVFAEEAAAIVFELPLVASAGGFPPEKFQAWFRVNKASRALEDIVVKAREPIRMAGGVSLKDVGTEVRFRTLDPAFPPQPVWLRGGGAVRVLLVTIARDFETTRAEFRRVEPYIADVPVEP